MFSWYISVTFLNPKQNLLNLVIIVVSVQTCRLFPNEAWCKFFQMKRNSSVVNLLQNEYVRKNYFDPLSFWNKGNGNSIKWPACLSRETCFPVIPSAPWIRFRWLAPRFSSSVPVPTGHFLKSGCVTLSFYPSSRTLLRAPLAITIWPPFGLGKAAAEIVAWNVSHLPLSAVLGDPGAASRDDKLSPEKTASSRLAAPGSPRMALSLIPGD